MSATTQTRRAAKPAPDYWPGQARVQPLFVWPWRLAPFVTWLFGFPGYLWPWNAAYFLIAVATWTWATPDLAALQALAPWAIAAVFARNLALCAVVYGLWHVPLYLRRSQGFEFKYNGRWLAKDNDNFLFRDQLKDNMFWTFASGVPIWTLWEVATLWAQGKGYAPTLRFADHPVGFVALFLLLPVFCEAHFYLVHRLIHWPPLYRAVHKLHHNNMNPGPFSGLSMHPVEHLLYFSGALLHWIVASHPLHVIFHLQHRAFAPAMGHNGFHSVRLPGGAQLAADHYVHYLHHKYFEVNYGDGLVPFDRLFGTFHDGTDAATEAMNRRFLKKA